MLCNDFANCCEVLRVDPFKTALAPALNRSHVRGRLGFVAPRRPSARLGRSVWLRRPSRARRTIRFINFYLRCQSEQLGRRVVSDRSIHRPVWSVRAASPQESRPTANKFFVVPQRSRPKMIRALIDSLQLMAPPYYATATGGVACRLADKTRGQRNASASRWRKSTDWAGRPLSRDGPAASNRCLDGL